MREQEFANWMFGQRKSTGEPYAEHTIRLYITYIGRIEEKLGSIDNVPLSNSESFLEKVGTSFPELAEHTAHSYRSGASAYFDFRRSVEERSPN